MSTHNAIHYSHQLHSLCQIHDAPSNAMQRPFHAPLAHHLSYKSHMSHYPTCWPARYQSAGPRTPFCRQPAPSEVSVPRERALRNQSLVSFKTVVSQVSSPCFFVTVSKSTSAKQARMAPVMEASSGPTCVPRKSSALTGRLD